MPERTNSGLMGLPRIRTSVDHLHGSEDVPLINRDPSGREKKSNGLTRYVVPALGGALVMTLVTLAATHHSSLPPQVNLDAVPSMDASDTRAALAAMTHPADDHDDEDAIEPETETAPVDVIAAEAEDAESVPTPRAPKRRAQVGAFKSPFESESEEILVDDHDSRRARKVPKRVDHSAASDGASDSDDDIEFSLGSAARLGRASVGSLDEYTIQLLEQVAMRDARVEQPMDLDAYTGATERRTMKLEKFREVVKDEAYLRSVLARAVREVAAGHVFVKGDPSSKMALELSYSLAELDREGRSFGEWNMHRSEETPDARMGQSEDADAEAPEAEPKDARFEDASWSEDDYLNGNTGSKDFGSVSRLDPVVRAPGAPSEKTDDEVMKKLLKHVEDNKEELADNSIGDDGKFDEDEFIAELVREGAVIAPEDEPERAKKTNSGEYLEGGFAADDLKRIIDDKDERDLDAKANTFPQLESADVEDNAREEVPEAFIDQDMEAVQDAVDNLQQSLDARDAADEAEAPEPAEAMDVEAPAPAPEEEQAEAEGPAATPTDVEADSAAPAPGPAEEETEAAAPSAEPAAEEEEAAEEPAASEEPAADEQSGGETPSEEPAAAPEEATLI
jgi:hypothetical protein